MKNNMQLANRVANGIEFEGRSIKGIETPVLLPVGSKIISFVDGRFVYEKENGEQKNTALYMHKDEPVAIVDEFRNLFPHESMIVLLFDGNGNMFLQRRGVHESWEPEKIDLASVVCQWRSKVENTFLKKMELEELALFAINKETGIEKKDLDEEKVFILGNHINEKTNEFQTVCAYDLEISLDELNEKLKTIDQEGQQWFCQSYKKTMDEYMGSEVSKYAGGSELRPRNFISNETVLESLKIFLKKETR